MSEQPKTFREWRKKFGTPSSGFLSEIAEVDANEIRKLLKSLRTARCVQANAEYPKRKCHELQQ